LLLLTGQRRQEIGDLAWSKMPEGKRQIGFPEHRTKNKRPHIVLLSGPWRSCPSGARLVTSCSASKPADSAAGPSQRRISMLGLPRPAKANPCWTLHDLRRSFVTNVSALGCAQPHALEAIDPGRCRALAHERR
jgi:integrase